MSTGFRVSRPGADTTLGGETHAALPDLATSLHPNDHAATPAHHSNANDHVNSEAAHSWHTAHHAELHSITDVADHTFPGGVTFLRADGTFVAPTASVNIKETEVDFGEGAVNEEDLTFTITDADVSGTSQIIAYLSGAAPTGRDQDDVLVESLDAKCAPGTGQFDMHVQSLAGPVHGKFKFNYLVG